MLQTRLLQKYPMYSDKYGYFFVCPHCSYLNIINPNKSINDRWGCHECNIPSKISNDDLWHVKETWKLYELQ